MNLDEINKLHDEGRMPDWVWLQQNGRSAEENYIYLKKKMQREYEADRREKQQSAALEEYVSKMIEEKLESSLEKCLDDLLKDFK